MMDQGEDPTTPPAPGQAGYAPFEDYEAEDTGIEVPILPPGRTALIGGQEAGDLMAPIATERGEGRRPPGLVPTPSEFHGGAADVVGDREELLSPEVQGLLEGALKDGILNQSQYTALLEQHAPSDLAEALWITAKQAGITPTKEFAEMLKKHIRRTESAEDLGMTFDPFSREYQRHPPAMKIEETAGGPLDVEKGVTLSSRDEEALQEEANRKAVYDQLVAEREQVPSWRRGELSDQGELALSDEEKRMLDVRDRTGVGLEEQRELQRQEYPAFSVDFPTQGELKSEERQKRRSRRRKKRTEKKETEQMRKELKANLQAGLDR